MSAVVAAGRRVLPRGWRDLGLQVVIWLGFYFSYLAVRSAIDRNPARALTNGLRVIDFEQRVTSSLFEQTAQRVADSSHVLLTAAAWTYWNSEFTVITGALLFVYLRRHEWFGRFRNTVLLTNMIGLIGYLAMPTAPPWMFPSFGFVDGVNHAHDLVSTFGNPYAAMPSLHAGDALIVGFFCFRACRHWWSKTLWALWPAWVWFCVLATANHFWLDVLAGVTIAAVAIAVVTRISARRRVAPIANLL